MPTIDALLGIGDLTDEDRMRSMADSLRDQKRAADVFSISSVKPIAQGARAEGKGVLDAAQRAGTRRQTALTRASRKEERAQQQSNWQAEQAFKKEKLRQTIASKEAIARMKATNAGKTAWKDVPASEKKKYRIAGKISDTMPGIITAVEANPDAFGQGSNLAEYYPEFFPRAATEFTKVKQAANRTKEQNSARNRVYQEAYKVINQLAGSALSVNEATRIEQFLPAQNDEPEVIIGKLKDAIREADNNVASFVKVYELETNTIQVQDEFKADLTEVPEGLTPTEWEDLSNEDKVFYLENEGNI
jgi:hypothetical protein